MTLTLAREGQNSNIYANTICPIALTQWTTQILINKDNAGPEYVAPFITYLSSELCKETGNLFEVGGGFITKLRW